MRVELVEVHIKLEYVELFIEHVQQHALESREEAGCIQYDVMRDVEHIGTFYIYETFVDDDAKKIHDTSDNANWWRGISASWREGASAEWNPDKPPYVKLITRNVSLAVPTAETK
jgi:quinol monooxygenase YgiN